VEDVQTLRQQEQRLRETCSSMTETLLQQKQDLQHLQAQTEQIPSIQDELARLQGQMAEDREKARILDETMILLQQARERLSTNYMDTIRSRFGWYMTQLEASCGEQYLIDTDFQVYPERMGQMRELAYFSAGQTDLVMLCMRLALVDALFREENMFVILDDPFVNLDDAHTAQGCKLLRNLAAKRQILYLTCHSSRSI
jgi:DNA repair exonuclease SbcCD ATPase subunit